MADCIECETLARVLQIATPVSPISETVRQSNGPPTDMIAQQIRAILDVAESNIEALDFQICRVQGMLSSLMAERNAQRLFYDSHRSYISLMRRMPPEILGLVMVHCVDEDITSRAVNVARMSSALAPSQVCQRWRQVALATPSLWTYICVRTGSHSSVALVDLFLTRSGSCPIDIIMTTDEKLISPVDFSQILKTVYPHRNRWRFFRYGGITNKEISFLSTPLQLPLLRNLYIDYRWKLADTVHPRVEYFSEAPKLRHVVLRKIPYGDINLPWSQLTYLDAGLGTVAEHIKAASACSHLAIQEFAVHLHPGLLGIHAFERIPHVTLTTLTKLTVLCGRHHASCFLQYLTLPSLENLRYRQKSELGTGEREAIAPLIYRSRCRLKSLDIRIDAGPFNDRALLPILEAVPELHTLVASELSCAGLSDYILGRIREAHLLPSLKQLALNNRLPDRALVEMIRGRRPILSPRDDEMVDPPVFLRSLAFKTLRGASPEWIQHLRQLAADGLVVGMIDEDGNASGTIWDTC